jgi:MFS family permease
MNHRIQLKENIKRNYIFTLIQNIDLTRGIWMIYLADKGMSLTELGLLETIFHIASFLMEVPTGAVADIFGRKISRISGRVLSLISVIILLAVDSFLWFAISFVVTALSYNLESGAGDALIYDSLKEIGEEAEYMKISGKKEVFYQAAGIISFLAGGYLASKSYNTAFVITIVFGLAAILQSTSFKEPSIGRMDMKDDRGNIFLIQLKDSISVIRKNPRIAFLIIFTEVILTFCTCIFYYLQNFLKGSGYNEAIIGVIYAVAYTASALSATQVHRIEKLFKERGMLLIMPFAAVGCVWGIAVSRFHYIFFILLMITEEIVYVTTNDYINKMIPSENRATILSFASMACSFFMILLFPLIGALGDRYSLGFAMMCLAGIGSIFALVNSTMMLNNMAKSRG